jgi:hypothetical protein
MPWAYYIAGNVRPTKLLVPEQTILNLLAPALDYENIFASIGLTDPCGSRRQLLCLPMEVDGKLVSVTATMDMSSSSLGIRLMASWMP